MSAAGHGVNEFPSKAADAAGVAMEIGLTLVVGGGVSGERSDLKEVKEELKEPEKPLDHRRALPSTVVQSTEMKTNSDQGKVIVMKLPVSSLPATDSSPTTFGFVPLTTQSADSESKAVLEETTITPTFEVVSIDRRDKDVDTDKFHDNGERHIRSHVVHYDAPVVVAPSGAGTLAVDAEAWTATDAASLLHLDFVPTKGGVKKKLTGRGVRIAILDTGFEVKHPALEKLNIMETVNCCVDVGTAFSPLVPDFNGHGTHVASLAGLVCPDAQFYLVKVFKDERNGDKWRTWTSTDWILHGLQWAKLKSCDIVNLSLGYRHGTSDMALNAWIKCLPSGMSIVAAAGNTQQGYEALLRQAGIIQKTVDHDFSISSTLIGGLAWSSRVITVGAWCMRSNEVPAFSCFTPDGENGRKPDVIAPGVEIRGAYHLQVEVEAEVEVIDEKTKEKKIEKRKTGKNQWTGIPMSGTSMAAPLVTGVLARMLEFESRWDRTDLASRLCAGCDPVYTPRDKHRSGAGIPNLSKILRD